MPSKVYDPTLEDKIARMLMGFVCHNQKPFSKKLNGFIATGCHDIRAGSAALEIINMVRAYDSEQSGTMKNETSDLIKKCPTCRVDYTIDSWAALPLIKRGPEHSHEPSSTVEIRQCPCGKALSAIVNEPVILPRS